MKLLSNTLGIEFDLDVYQRVENGKVVSIIAHNTLSALFIKMQFDHALKGDPILLHYRDVVVLNNHTVVEATINYKGVDFLPQAGESVKETLNNSIAMNYSYLETQKRAFDRAVIAFLGFPIKIYSDKEIPVESLFDVKNGFELPIPQENQIEATKPLSFSDIKKTLIPLIPAIPTEAGKTIEGASREMLEWIANNVPDREYNDIGGKVRYYLQFNAVQ